MSDRQGFWKALGPGLLFAAAAVGVSHLVQSTRAGADYGLLMVSLVLLANAAKYPAFRFGPQYAAATGTSLLEGYRKQGRFALVLYAGLTLMTMFTVQAVVTVVTAGLAIATFGIDPAFFGGGPNAAVVVSALLIATCGTLLAVGHYRLLDRLTKVLVLVLAISTLLATALVLPRIDWQSPLFPAASQVDRKMILFAAALVGWMPSAIDVAVWQSLWTLARSKDSGHAPTIRESMADFHLGYLGTAFFALCFLAMGAGVMHGRGIEFADSAGQFAAQVIRLYTETLGDWSAPLIGASAFAVMFSTTLTVVDGFPRAIATLVARFRSEETVGELAAAEGEHRRTYWLALAVLAIGSVLLLALFLKSLKTMVDVATTLSFITAPVLSLLNHRAVLGSEVPAEGRPRPWLVAMSWAGIAFQAAFALFYLYLIAS